MEAKDALKTDRFAFDSELNDLITHAFRTESFPAPNQLAFQQPAAKRVKTEQGAVNVQSDHQDKDDEVLAHKTPKVLQDRTNIQQSRVAPLGKDIGKSNRYSTRKRAPLSDRRRRSLSPSRAAHDTKPSLALANTVHRQWNPFRDNMAYEQLLDLRRNEKLEKVDRYVPESRPPQEAQPASPAVSESESDTFPLTRLPEAILTKILRLCLVRADPITIDISWMRSSIQDRTRIPSATQKVYHDGGIYLLPTPWNELHRRIDHMREDMQRFGMAGSDRSNSIRRSYSPCRGLETALLHVSRHMHKVAAAIFYSENVFNFPCGASAWIQFHSFLSTIGSENMAHLSQMRIHIPLWHRGIHDDHIEGSILDILSPLSRLTTIQPATHDRLLSSIRYTTQTLQTSAPNLRTLSLSLENGIAADYWTGRYVNGKRLLSLPDAEEFVERKRQGIAMLKELSDRLAAASSAPRPRLTLEAGLQCVGADKKEFRRRFTGLVEEAAKYGWDVDADLREGR